MTVLRCRNLWQYLFLEYSVRPRVGDRAWMLQREVGFGLLQKVQRLFLPWQAQSLFIYKTVLHLKLSKERILECPKKQKK